MAIEIKAPKPWERGKFTIFLAGAIDQNKAEDWQTQIVEALADYDVLMLNPRRDDWDANWEQSAADPQFREQVLWEQHGLDEADFRTFVLLDESKAPITLLELGEHIDEPGAVCCEPEYYRKGNVDISATLNKMPVFESLDGLIGHLTTILEEKGLRSKGEKTAASSTALKYSQGNFPLFQDFLESEGGLDGLLSGDDWQTITDRSDPPGFDKLSQEDQRQAIRDRAFEDQYRAYEEALAIHESHRFPLAIYREVTLKEGIESLRTVGIGEYWSWDIEAAEAHWGGTGSTFLLKALADEKAIDWRMTILQNMQISTGEDEKEIHLRKGARVKLVGYKEITGSRRNREDDGQWTPIPGVKTVTAGSSAVLTPEESESSVAEQPDKLPVTETPAFKSWFGKSKVVDADGNPRVVHHKTHNDFDEFDRQWAAKRFGRDPEGTDTIGLWFTENSEIQYGPKNMDVYLSIQRPLVFWDEPKKGCLDQLMEMVAEVGGTTNLRNELKAHGYDGIKFEDTHLDWQNQTVWIALEPNQIKSANANTGTFDPKSNKITASTSHPMPRFFFHGTDDPESALRKGFRPHVYLTQDPILAEAYKDHHGIDGDWTVLKIDSSFLNENHLKPDDYEFVTMWENNTEEEKHGWGDDPAKVPWWESMKLCRQVIYDGPIPAKAISVLPQSEIPDGYHEDVWKKFEADMYQPAQRTRNASWLSPSEQLDERLTAFLHDLWSQTTPNPLNDKEVIWQNTVGIEAKRFHGRIHLSSIRSLAEGQGQASAALEFLKSLADKHAVELEVVPVPFGARRLSQSQLRSWYVRHGFKLAPEGVYYVYSQAKSSPEKLKLDRGMLAIPMDKSASEVSYKPIKPKQHGAAVDDDDCDDDGSDILEYGELGAPAHIVLYHGTNADITHLELGTDGLLWFSNDPEWALNWGKNVVQAEVRIDRPFVEEDAGYHPNWINCAKDIARVGEKHDGIILRNAGDSLVTYAVFSPSQAVVKGIGNNGAFDPNGQSITAATQPIAPPTSPGFQPWYTDKPQGEYDPDFEPVERPVVETSEFKAWFGDSKVVDANGNPLVVYHATSNQGKSFANRNKGYGQFGHWFDASPGLVESYALGDQPHHQPNVIPVYLSIKNPKVFPDTGTFKDAVNGKFGPNVPARAQKLRTDLKKQGFDGALIHNSANSDSGRPDFWVAFDQKQIKSAIGNSGEFSAKNKSIVSYLLMPKRAAEKCPCGHSWEEHGHEGDFGCKHESEGCGCLGFGYAEKKNKRGSLKLASATQERMVREARAYQNSAIAPGEPGWVDDPSTLRWVDEPAFDLHRVAGFDTDSANWRWLVRDLWDRAQEGSSLTEAKQYYDAMKQAVIGHTIDPVLLVEDADGKFYIWDGNHRVALAYVLKVGTMPAWVGYQKTTSDQPDPTVQPLTKELETAQ